MTLTELLQIGDEVVFNIDPAQHAYMDIYKDVPDGTKGVVCGFYDAIIYEGRTRVTIHESGIYHRKGAVSILLSDGRIVPGDSVVEMTDTNEQNRRDDAMRNENGVFCAKQVRLGDLPSTPFWEEDKVRVRFPKKGDEHKMTIGHVAYGFMHKQDNDGSPWPFYGVHYAGGSSTGAEESWIELIERGNVWKYYHNEPITFGDIKEEAQFFQLIGHTEEVKNPNNGFYIWTQEEVLDAIRNGIAHGFSGSGISIRAKRFRAKRFRDEDLGQRVAQATLEEFDVASA